MEVSGPKVITKSVRWALVSADSSNDEPHRLVPTTHDDRLSTCVTAHLPIRDDNDVKDSECRTVTASTTNNGARVESSRSESCSDVLPAQPADVRVLLYRFKPQGRRRRLRRRLGRRSGLRLLVLPALLIVRSERLR